MNHTAIAQLLIENNVRSFYDVLHHLHAADVPEAEARRIARLVQPARERATAHRELVAA